MKIAISTRIAGWLGRAYHKPQPVLKNRTPAVALIAAGLLLWAAPVEAQSPDAKPVEAGVCTDLAEVVLKLKMPNAVTDMPWKQTLGVQGMERLLLAMPGQKATAPASVKDKKNSSKDKAAKPDAKKATPKETLLLAGESRAYDLRTRTVGERSFYIAHIDGKGEVSGEVRTKLPEGGRLERMVAAGSQIIALDRMTRKGGDVSHVLRRFSKDGKQVSENTVALPEGGITDVYAMLADGTGGSVYLSVAQRIKAMPPQSVLAHVTSAGKIDWKRVYLPGTDTAIYHLSKLPDGSLLGLGQMQLDSTRKAAWLMNLSASGALLGQAPLPRGKDARLLVGKALPDGTLLLAGTVAAADPKAGDAMWVMRSRMDGTPVWQRYYTAAGHALVPEALHILPDGRVNVLANAGPAAGDTKARTHVRQLTLSANGFLLGDVRFQQGAFTAATMYLPAADNSTPGLIIGNTRTGFVSEDAPADLKDAALDGIVIAASPLPDYKDPCKP